MGSAVRYALARLKAFYYILSCRLRGVHFDCGPRLRVFGKLQIKGPGRVSFGANVVIHGKVTPWTHERDARIIIGDNVTMSGTRFGCAREITIEKDCIVADARIMDTDFHSTRADRRSPSAPVHVASVRIGQNVWIAAAAAVLPGTTIGQNSVVGFGAVCRGAYSADKVILGNPAKVAMQIPPLESSLPMGPSGTPDSTTIMEQTTHRAN